VSDHLVADYNDTTVTVSDGSGSTQDLHVIWLRDSCDCPGCRRRSTNERLLDSTTIPLNITILSIEETRRHLVVNTSDGHAAVIDWTWLNRHIRSISQRDAQAADTELWSFNDDAIATFAASALERADGVARWTDAILKRGIACVSGVEPALAGLRSVASLIGEIRATNYGVTWTIEADLEPVSAVDSERQLRVHTDLPYREISPGIQLLLAVVVDVPGGATTLVDGYAVAEKIRLTDPQAWELLTTVEFSYPFVRDDVELVGRAPIIGLHSNGGYHQIRWAPDLVGSPFLDDPVQAPALFAALATWSSLVDDPANEIRIALESGDLLAFNNHRMLHGRTAFQLGAHGRRCLIGCYLDVEDLRSRHAVLTRHR